MRPPANPEIKVNQFTKNNNGSYSLTITAKQVAIGVFVSFENVDGHFSENYFDIVPSQPIKLTFTPKDNQPVPVAEKISITHLTHPTN